MKVEINILLVSLDSFGPDELCWYEKRIHHSKQVLNKTRDRKHAEHSFTTMTNRNGSSSSVSIAVVYRKNAPPSKEGEGEKISAICVLQSSRCPGKTGYCVRTLHGLKTQRKARERVMAWKSSNAL